jgi:hypothetical protein
MTGASDAAVLLLRRLGSEGIHLLGASQYVTLLLAAEKSPASGPPRTRPRLEGQAGKPHRKAQPDQSARRS